MAVVDWLIVAAILALMLLGVVLSRSHMRSVADFLAAGRSAGRYILSLSQGLAALGAITIVGLLEMNYVAGFSMSWWSLTTGVVILVLTISGWVVYRFRRTRSLTLPEFFQRRYSRNFRIYGGVMAFISGLINFGIFPAVGARFFIYFCGLPAALPVAGLQLPTFPLVMAILLGISVFFVLAGGQVAVIITDFIQGIFVNIVFVVISLYFMMTMDWEVIRTALATAPQDASLINPFKTSHVEDFNFWYFFIGIIGVIYNTMSWQGTQAYNASARNAHEARMGGILTNWRDFPRNLFLLFIPMVAYAVLHHPDFAAEAAAVQDILSGVGNDALQSQLRVPVVLATLLPAGLMGGLAAVMLAAFVSTHDTYLHSWGSIFVQDVVMPFRRRPFTPRQHLLALRLSVCGVAVFIFLFSLLFQQSQYIFLFFAITGAIFAGGAGAVIIGGLYWRRGTTAGAWAAMVSGSSIAVSGIIIHQFDPDFFINGQMFWALSMAVSSILYVSVSLYGSRPPCDLDRLLHRGRWAVAGEEDQEEAAGHAGGVLRRLGMGPETTTGDRVIIIASYCWTLGWTAVFIVGTIYNLTHDVADGVWAEYWRVFLQVQVVLSLVVIVWFSWGGLRDLRAMLRRLRTMTRDITDDGDLRTDEADGAEGKGNV